jgi:hypothetical protein
MWNGTPGPFGSVMISSWRRSGISGAWRYVQFLSHDAPHNQVVPNAAGGPMTVIPSQQRTRWHPGSLLAFLMHAGSSGICTGSATPSLPRAHPMPCKSPAHHSRPDPALWPGPVPGGDCLAKPGTDSERARDRVWQGCQLQHSGSPERSASQSRCRHADY